MFINDNIGALNAWRNLTSTQDAMGMSLKRLSSGLRINSAADDAAGLAISQKMQAQINGMQTAQDNAQNAQSMLQTAEGALGQSQNILQRMRQLSVQASSDTSTTADRTQMQTEMNQLTQELTRISNTTQYNTKNLTDGTLTNATIQIGANANQNLNFSVGAMDAFSLGVVGNTVSSGSFVAAGGVSAVSNFGAGFGQLSGTNAYKVVVANYTQSSTGGGAITNTLSNAGSSADYTNTATAGAGTYTGSIDRTFKVAVTNQTAGLITSVAISSDGGATYGGNIAITNAANNVLNLGYGLSFTLNQSNAASGGGAVIGDTFAITASAAKVDTTLQDTNSIAIGSTVTTKFAQGTAALKVSGLGQSSTGKTLDVQFTGVPSAGTATFNLTTVAGGSAAVAGGAAATVIQGADLTSQGAANLAIGMIDKAIESVSTQRANLGAYQNRLQYTVDNLSLTAQNLTDARSRITDADMAKEMSTFTKHQILQQAGVSMLAQANSMPQALMKLLQ